MIRLIKNIVVIGAIALLGFIVYFYFFKDSNDKLLIDETPIHIESIKTIAEISTVSYKDEIVMDTCEYYKKKSSLYDPREWIRMYDRNIKRRLTLIIKGEVKYGLDLTDSNFELNANQDTVWLKLPQPKILDIIVSPSNTEVFQEQGVWRDSDVKRLEGKAKSTLKQNAHEFKLDEKAAKNAKRLFKKLIQTNKTLVISFNYEK